MSSLEIYSNLIQSSRKSLGELKRSSDAEYRDTSTVQLDIQPRVSGLTEYYTNDLNYRELIELIPKSSDAGAGTVLKAKKLLPCDARLCAQNTRVEIANVRADVERSRMQLMSDGSHVYDVRCDSTQHAGYLQ